jgi:hypothetical protein
MEIVVKMKNEDEEESYNYNKQKILYEVSNIKRIGLSEIDLLKEFHDGITALFEQER